MVALLDKCCQKVQVWKNETLPEHFITLFIQVLSVRTSWQETM